MLLAGDPHGAHARHLGPPRLDGLQVTHQVAQLARLALDDGLELGDALLSPLEARAALDAEGITYIPLGALDAEALRLLQLRQVLGLRSPLNTALILKNSRRSTQRS